MSVVDKPSAKVPPPFIAPPQLPDKRAVTLVVSALNAAPSSSVDDAMKCERCGADMYRMHAGWRCPSCRFKTDCCGW
jgi:hypothetical protein